jgi:hypothetical protein
LYMGSGSIWVINQRSLSFEFLSSFRSQNMGTAAAIPAIPARIIELDAESNQIFQNEANRITPMINAAIYDRFGMWILVCFIFTTSF